MNGRPKQLDPETLVFYGFVLVGFLFTLREVHHWRVSAQKLRNQFEGPLRDRDRVAAMFDGIPEALKQLRKMEMEMIAKKASPEQLKPVQDRINWLERINTWSFILEPLAEYLLPSVKKLKDWL